MSATRNIIVALTVVAGSVLVVAPAGAATAHRNDTSHIVQSGDTVASIARRYGVSQDSVVAANGIVDGRLYVGARVKIDGSASTGSGSSGSTSSKSSAKAGTYTIKWGDALERIARHNGVTIKALLAANGLKATSLILPGDKLVIPGGSASSSSSSSSSSGSAASSSQPSTGPRIVCPVHGSYMNDWGFPRGGSRFHEGTDVFAKRGTTVVAPISGTVRFGSNKLGGKTFTITSPSGWVAYGAHMDSIIGSGGTIKAGTPVGTVGDSGNAKGGDTHLHLGFKRSGSWVNPYPSLRASCG